MTPDIRHFIWPVPGSLKMVSLGDSKAASERVFWAHGDKNSTDKQRFQAPLNRPRYGNTDALLAVEMGRRNYDRTASSVTLMQGE